MDACDLSHEASLIPQNGLVSIYRLRIGFAQLRLTDWHKMQTQGDLTLKAHLLLPSVVLHSPQIRVQIHRC